MLENRKRSDFSQFLAIGNPTQDRPFIELCVKTVGQIWQGKKLVKCKDEANKQLLGIADDSKKDENKDENEEQRQLLLNNQEFLKTIHSLLFSGHGKFDPESSLESGLLFYHNQEQYDLLKLTEIFGLDLSNCRLVTLIACEAAMTDWTSITDEYISIPSAFLWAGVEGIVSALWTVEEKASVFLGIKFYQILLNQQGEKDVIKALREAQFWLRNVTKNGLLKWLEESKIDMSYINELFKNELFRSKGINTINDWLQPQPKKPFSNPYYWAAFCVVGK
jgi:CHAT domain-containing protein